MWKNNGASGMSGKMHISPRLAVTTYHTLDISLRSSFYDQTISVLWRSLDALWQSDSARVQLKGSECESSTGVG